MRRSLAASDGRRRRRAHLEHGVAAWAKWATRGRDGRANASGGRPAGGGTACELGAMSTFAPHALARELAAAARHFSRRIKKRATPGTLAHRGVA
jgi:hypothetical protein